MSHDTLDPPKLPSLTAVPSALSPSSVLAQPEITQPSQWNYQISTTSAYYAAESPCLTALSVFDTAYAHKYIITSARNASAD